MSIKFSHALLFGAVVYLGAEVLIGLNRPLIADRWVSNSIQVIKDGKQHSIDAQLEMDVFSRGSLTDPQFDKSGYGSRFQFKGDDQNLGMLLGFPVKAYTMSEGSMRLLDDGFCDIKSLKRQPGINGDVAFFTEKDCPDFIVRHMVGDRVQYITEKNGIQMKVSFERDTRLNPLALAITRWNRHNYLPNAEKFLRESPI